MRVLILNCGSSTLKFDVLEVDDDNELQRHAAGAIDRVGGEAEASLQAHTGSRTTPVDAADHAQAFAIALQLLEEGGYLEGVEAIGHRVVHGGEHFQDACLIDSDVIDAIEAVSELAPLHNDRALQVVRAARSRFGDSFPMIADFDTAFFADLPEAASQYALPQDIVSHYGIRRFGFHGLAHRYMVERYRVLHPGATGMKLVTLQLGNGCSVTATIDGRPVDTSMGFTPLEGLIMGTRSGDIDPSLPLFLVSKAGMSASEVESLLNHRSGLLGLSGRSSDMRELQSAAAHGDARSGLAIEAFCLRARKYVGAYVALMGGVDAVIFGGGIGENSAEVRSQICVGLEWAGLRLDKDRNQKPGGRETRITAMGSGIEAWVVHVDEASVIAGDVVRVLEHDVRRAG
jgi:acetate kinase